MSDQIWQNAGRYEAVHASRQAGPVRLILGAVAFYVLVGLVVGIGVGITAAAMGIMRPGQRGLPLTIVAWALVAQQALLLLITLWRAGRRGSLVDGLGWQRITRPGVAAGTAAGAVGLAALHMALVLQVPGYRSFIVDAVPGVLRGLDSVRPLEAILLLLVAVVGAPVVEELFFRGWLWTRLRKHWGAWPTGLTTGALFLLAHVPDGGWRRVAMLVPVTVLLSVAREAGGSVRASMLVHATNNTALVVAMVGAALLGLR